MIDEAALHRAFERIRKDVAIGVDGVTKDAYAKELDTRIQDLHGRLKTKLYRHQPIRRVHNPKAPGKTRAIGISCIEDKIRRRSISFSISRSMLSKKDSMSASSTQAASPVHRIRFSSRSAWCALRPGRKPYEQGKKSCSWIASSNSRSAP